MHITNECDYALRIVIYVAQCGQRIDAQTISADTEVPQRFAIKILRNLVAAGLVKSYKGAGGGYEIGYSPDEMTMYDVIRVVEGDYVFCRCLDTSICTCKTGMCPSRDVFEEITNTVVEKLTSVTIRSIMSKK